MRFEKTYSIIADSSPPMKWPDYKMRVENEWRQLLTEVESDEKTIQQFLEKHPCLVPGAFSLPMPSGHGPFPSAVITQPILTGLTTKLPDFMWIAMDSCTLYPVLIEIEDPKKHWFTKKGRPTADLTQAIDQLTSWRRWFEQPENLLVFEKMYELTAFLADKRVQPQFVLVYGRRSEFKASPGLNAKRGQMMRSNEVFMTFDRLAIEEKARELMCVKLSKGPEGANFEALTIPATFTYRPGYAEDRAKIIGKERAINKNGWITSKRKEFLLSRLTYWDEWSRSSNRGIIHSADCE